MHKDDRRFHVEGKSVVFHMIDARPHISFSEKYKGMTYSQARRKMRTLFYNRHEQDELIHYLTSINYIRKT